MRQTDRETNQKPPPLRVRAGLRARLSRISFAARIALGYLLIGGLSLLALQQIGAAFGQTSAPSPLWHGWPSLLFIVLSAAVLYATLRLHEPLREPAAGSSSDMADKTQRSAVPIFLLFVGLSLGITLIAYLDLQHTTRNLLAHQQDEQENVVALNLNEMAYWISERQIDLRILAKGVERFSADLTSPDSLQALESYFAETLPQVESWDQIALYDPDGGLLLHIGADNAAARPPTSLIKRIASEQAENVTQLTEAGRGDPTDFSINLIVALHGAGPLDKPTGALLLTINPQRRLRELVHSWPVPGATSDMYLLRHAGDLVSLFGSRAGDMAFLPSADIAPPGSLIATALDQEKGRFEGPDRYGRTVIATFTVIPGTPWHFIAKTERAEVLQPLVERRVMVVFTSLLLIAGAGLLAGLLWRNQQLAFIAFLQRQTRDNTAVAQHFDKFFQLARDIYLLMDERGRIVEANEAACAAYGYARDELIGKNIDELRAQDAHGAMEHQAPANEEEGALFETLHLRRYGTSFPVEISCRTLEAGGKLYRQNLIRDITLRKQAELSAKEMSRIVMATRLANSIMLRSENEDAMYDDMCRAIVEIGHYRMACICLAMDDPDQSTELAAMAGQGLDSIRDARISWGDNRYGRYPSSFAIRTGKVQVHNNFYAELETAPWRDGATANGFRSCIALPLKVDGTTFGALCIYAAESNRFNDAEETLLTELANDVSFGVGVLRLRLAERTAAQKLAEGMKRTIQLLAETMELRDPYTSGHQQRVADLAKAIAQEMRLDGEQIQGIYLAGLVHDIGKIAVPSEFLTKPSRLTEQEMALVRTHSAVGADLIKGIDFPWPIAEIVRSHHEKLDGSGYPAGLKGDEISVGARVIAVADMVEAISAHRPYRPALGLDRALQEVEALRGIKLDAAAVDACLALFRSGRFAFSDRPA